MLEKVRQLTDIMHSSYKENNYGLVFYSLVRCLKPLRCIEIGTLEGYSTLFIAAALKDNDNDGHLCAYDLWEDYEHRHVSQNVTQANIDIMLLQDYVTLTKMNAYYVMERWPDDRIDFIHVDISNDGEIFDRFLREAAPKLISGGILIFEGGSVERDAVDWMDKFNKPKIQHVIESHRLMSEPIYDIVVIEPFPSITICTKR